MAEENISQETKLKNISGISYLRKEIEQNVLISKKDKRFVQL